METCCKCAFNNTHMLFGHVTQKPGFDPAGPSPHPAGYVPPVQGVQAMHTLSIVGFPPSWHVVAAYCACFSHCVHACLKLEYKYMRGGKSNR